MLKISHMIHRNVRSPPNNAHLPNLFRIVEIHDHLGIVGAGRLKYGPSGPLLAPGIGIVASPALIFLFY